MFLLNMAPNAKVNPMLRTQARACKIKFEEKCEIKNLKVSLTFDAILFYIVTRYVGIFKPNERS